MSSKISSAPVLFNHPSFAQVDKAIVPTQMGRVKFQASFWMAQFHSSECQAVMHPGEWVRVIGRQGIKLLVEPMHQGVV